MHKSEEIIEVVAKLKDEVMGLDIPDVVAATIFLNEGKDKVRMWDLSSLEHDDNYLEVPFDITFEIKKTDPHLYVKRVWENPENFFVEKQDEKDFKRLMQWLRELHKNEIADEVEGFIEKTQLKRLYHSAIKLNSGKLVIDQLTHPSDEMETILTKMGAAFDLAYKRFEDLKNAEAQTREAQIEAAIERVRSKSMAMHKSSELRDVVNTLHIEFRSLNLNFHVAAIQLFLEETKDLDLWIATDDGLYSDIIHWPHVDLRLLNEMNKARKSKTNIEILLSKSETTEFFDEYFKLDGTPQERKAALSSVELVDIIAFYQANTGIFIMRYSQGNFTDEEKNITQRFSKVFEQSYTRFLDLQKAEKQAREAQIETSLERVRSRTLAMQTSEELAETSVIVFKQLLELGIAPNRLFIGIVKSDNDTIEAWTTNEDGSKLAIHFSPQASKNKSIKKMLDGWKQQKKSIIIDMKGKELESYFRYLNEDMKIPFIDGLKQKRRVQTIAYFSGGLIGMAAAEEQPDNTIHLLERFAAVFNLTYTRFKDLKIAEANAEKAKQDLIKLQAAKKSAEEALSELQLTQTQLIQSEKMASLGELTAGIAHEIQNPLNFVNNFSEVSKELLDEMIEELENGDIEEVKAITDDVIQNLEKINHHGKRADGIVKGMLQHSRSSTGTKEPTNINALADEYLRLAYHGLRAKDKSFNATLETDFDESITTVDVIPQDIGRVILNLFTNAFYACAERSRSAVNEKKNSGQENYVPTVSISTKKIKNTLEIKVSDNGNGMPNSVKEKIFQPFFTTKPTGQGTGLGLSMSYDIITKGHGGKLSVETSEGQGTTFKIILPL
jgi:signal transduction histidine kinase